MVISTAADKKMVDDVEQKLNARMDQVEKEFEKGLEKLNDKLTIWIKDFQKRCSTHSRVVNDELRQLVQEYIAESVTNTPASAVHANYSVFAGNYPTE